ncbi:MAG: prepilin-type N-terminal cleavage/methylation domain-containing protein [Clostridia bacterium]|nr:prepilin-type N-terminal cleavage/methylation domain-containing protein [Clostridia bacterium]
MKRLLKDKRGMSLMELLVALSLLMIVIVGTTPVMLSSYSSLYTAGEKTQASYDAKSEIEDTLATRNSINIVENFKVNFRGLGEVAAINGKRAVSSLENSLETIFAGGRAHVAIVSSKVINDDKLIHDVILQTTNIVFKSTLDISYNNPEHVISGAKAVDVSLYLPDKSSNALASIYSKRANTAEKGIIVDNANPATGRIYVQVKGVDFTNSPAKIEVTYRDENDKVKRTSCYLTIKTPTIMMVGSTTYGDYYTTAGVETFKNPDGSTYNKLAVDARRMDISGTKTDYTKAIPSGTVFKSVNWITEQTATTGEFVESAYEPNYYVLTGTNGAIYRTYSFKEYNTSFIGKTNLSISSNDTAAFTQKYHPVISQAGQDVLGIADSIYTLDDAQSTVVYPAVWGGDFSHIFGYSAYDDQAGYTNRTDPDRSSLAWYTEDTSNNGVGIPGYYSNFANMAYYYNGWALDTPFYSMNSRKISYILTELPYAIRVGALMGDVGSVDNYGYDGTTFDRIWEQPNDPVTGDHLNEIDVLHFKLKNWIGVFQSEGWYYGAPGQNFARSTIIRSNTDNDGDFQDDFLHTLPVYFVDNGGDDKRRGDNGFAQIRLKALTTLSPTIVQERGGHTDSSSDMRVAYNTGVNQSKVIVTDAVYIPQTSTTSGGVFYIGTTAAYGWITQVDNYAANNVTGMQNTDSSNTGWPTFFWVKSNDEGTNTTVFKTTVHSDAHDIDWSGYRNLLIKNTSLSDSTPVEANSNESHNFYVIQPAHGATTGRLFSDVYFTRGFTSNSEML